MGLRVVAFLMGISMMLLSSSVLVYAEMEFIIDEEGYMLLISSSVIKEPNPKNNESRIFEQYTRPTFGLDHENYETMVDTGFKFNDKSFSIKDNYHTPFEEQSVNIGEVNSFKVTTYAQKGLRVQEFLFGIPIVGEAHLAELGVEVWYGYDGEIENVKTIQKSSVIDKDSIIVTHEKTKCQASDIEQNCDTTNVSMVFLEPLRDKVMAIKAIDYKNRYQITYLNEGFDVIGESLNPMHTFMIPSDIKGEGLLQVTQTEKYSSYWKTEDGRTFERNDFGSFKQTNKSFERFQDTGEPRTRMHSGFGGMLDYEKSKATQVFDASLLISEPTESFTYNFTKPDERMTGEPKTRMHSGFGGMLDYEKSKAAQVFDASLLISELPDRFAYVFAEPGEKLTEEVKQIKFLQEEIAKEILKQTDRQTRDY